jgi:hypothetical protein
MPIIANHQTLNLSNRIYICRTHVLFIPVFSLFCLFKLLFGRRTITFLPLSTFCSYPHTRFTTPFFLPFYSFKLYFRFNPFFTFIFFPLIFEWTNAHPLFIHLEHFRNSSPPLHVLAATQTTQNEYSYYHLSSTIILLEYVLILVWSINKLN